MITVDAQDPTTLKVNHSLVTSKNVDLDIYLFVPSELRLTRDVITENEFFYSSITQKRVYYSNQHLLPLVHSRLAQRGHLSPTQYRVSLSLFAYQYAIALDKTVKLLINNNDTNNNEEESDNATLSAINELIELSTDILKRLRRTIPFDEPLKLNYINIDNYLSWYSEQRFLALIAHLPRDNNYAAIKEMLIEVCKKEQQHRDLNHYNSKKAQEDVTRMSNKMRLLRRLIEHPIVLQENIKAMGGNISRAVKGIATGLVMIVVTTVLMAAREYVGEITISFIIAMSFIYALREIFKDDLRDILWRWLRKGKPKWRRRYIDPSTQKIVGSKLEWLDYQSHDQLSDKIQSIRKYRGALREEQILHYRSHTKMTTSRFLSGYEETRETMLFNLRELTRLMDKRSSKIYQLNDGQVSRESVEKRHLFNLIIKEDQHNGMPPNYYRWKVIMSRSKIVDIEKIDL